MPPDCYSPAPVLKADITVVRVTCWGFFFGIIQYADCRRAGPAQPPPFPPNTHCMRGHPCFFTHPFFCPPLYPMGLSSHQMVSTRHSVSFVLLPTQYRGQAHLRVSLYILYLLKSLQKCSSFSMGCGLCCPLEDSDKAVRMNFLGSSYICFQIQSLNYYFPRSHPSFRW